MLSNGAAEQGRAAAGQVAARPDSRRYVLLDGLRGIAALWVACYHIFHTGRGIKSLTPEPLALLLRHGDLGVAIFFVLSGFAIAWSVRGLRLGPGGVARFLLRRSLRLDPPYWATIAAAFATIALSNVLLRDRSAALPSTRDVILHILYLTDLVGAPKILDVFWTLFIEMQFYLVFVLHLWLSHALAARFGGHRWPLIVFGPGILAGLVASALPGTDWHGLCLPLWPYYALGVFAAWSHERTIAPRWVVVLLVAFLPALVARPTAFGATALATAVVIHLAASTDRLGVWLRAPLFQYLGRISYSLYLVHQLAGQRVTNLAFRVLGESPVATITSCLIGLASAIGAAHVLWWSVERPRLWLARRISLRKSSA